MSGYTRRTFSRMACGATAALVAGPRGFGISRADAAPNRFQFQLSDEQWRNRLSREQYRVLRKEGTERAHTSPLNNEKRAGTFACAGCGQALFSSRTKYESHTGWPSFWRPLPGAVGTGKDRSLGVVRNEVHCSRCGGHLGHVFNDGPPPTGLRYCMNSLAMSFRAARA